MSNNNKIENIILNDNESISSLNESKIKKLNIRLDISYEY